MGFQSEDTSNLSFVAHKSRRHILIFQNERDNQIAEIERLCTTPTRFHPRAEYYLSRAD